MKNVKKALVFVCSVAVLIAVWHFLAKKIASPLVLPSPRAVFERIFAFLAQKKFAAAFFATLKRCALSFSLSVAAGFALGLLCAFFPVCRAFFEPVLSLIRATPVIALILLALFWLKSDGVPVFIALLMTLPVMTTAVISAFSQKNDEDTKLQKMAAVFELSAAQKLLFLSIPRAFPAVSSGIKSAAGMTWKLVCAGEVLSLPRSAIGSFLQNAQVVLESADTFALTLIIVAASSLFCAMTHFFLIALKKAGRIAAHWYFLCDFPARKAPPSATSAVSIDHLSLMRSVLLYDDFSVQFPASSVSVILASSGLGKTTLLNVVAEQMRKDGVSYLFQEPRLLPCLTVLENVALPLRRFFGGKTAYENAKKMLLALQLGEKLSAFPNELSGGERQRAAMARSFCFPCAVLLLDEPFQSQDFALKQRLLSVLRECAAGKTVLAVTHDPHEAARIGGRILLLSSRPVRIALDLDCARLSVETVEKTVIGALLG